MAVHVHRITMFKLPGEDKQQQLIQAYKVLDQTSVKDDGKPYILSMIVGLPEEDPRSRGYTVACKTEFASMDDMKYYDEQCTAHQTLKATASDLGVGADGVLTVFFEARLTGGISP